MITLFTVGYEGQHIGPFIELLQAHGIEYVIDVRERPLSRKPDFSKRRLAAHLEAAGIGYSHLVELGTPKPIRDEKRRTHDLERFFAAVRPLLAAEPAALAQAVALAQAHTSALFCFEAQAGECHRRAVAEAMAQLAPLQVVDL